MKLLEVFKTGTHTDNKGNSKTWTDADLNTIVKQYNEQSNEEKHEAPLVIGHPATDKPAYGWVKALTKQGNKLYAEVKDVANEFVELVNQKRFGKLSIALYPDMKLRHIGFLGAEPPAIKGLASPEFSEAEFSVYTTEIENNKPKNNMEFAEMQDDVIKKITDEVRGKWGEEVANGLISILNKHKTSATTEKPAEKKEAPQFSESKAIKDLEEKLQKERNEMATKLEQLSKQNAEMQFNEMYNNSLSAGKVKPAQKEILKTIYFELKDKSVEFSEKTTNGADLFKDLLNSFDKKVEFNEIATGYSEDDDKELRELVKSATGGNN